MLGCYRNSHTPYLIRTSDGCVVVREQILVDLSLKAGPGVLVFGLGFSHSISAVVVLTCPPSSEVCSGSGVFVPLDLKVDGTRTHNRLHVLAEGGVLGWIGLRVGGSGVGSGNRGSGLEVK